MKDTWIALIVALAGLAMCPPPSVAADVAHTKPYNIAVIIKATDSDLWQYVIIGAVNYGLDNPDKAKVSWYGPKSEADIDKQVALLEDIISKKPDAIVIASTSSDATVPALENSIDQGVVVVTIDNKVHSDKTLLSWLPITRLGVLSARTSWSPTLRGRAPPGIGPEFATHSGVR
jgi:ABC-type sugar transport system substrate-binding protein